MSLATIYTRAPIGMQAPLVTVETHISGGLFRITLVGLPEKTVKESKDRVRAAIMNSGFEFPTGHITINLAPADLPKDGSRYDLAIALGILAASGQIPQALNSFEWHGELALSGELRAVNSILPCALAATRASRTIITPPANSAEAALIDQARIATAHSLQHIAAILHGHSQWLPPQQPTPNKHPHYPDFAEVKGQQHAKRALMIAAAGAHNVLMVGPPGTGKSMLAARLPSILPPMSEEEALESGSIFSISSQEFDFSQWKKRPFRAPHHSSSAAAMVGGGSLPLPGEISLAHGGILFLDELPEYERRVLEMLREPLECGSITISRALHKVDYPARFQLIAAMNPCPCGYYGDSQRACRDTPQQVARYWQKISGPLLDRIDMYLTINRIPTDELHSEPTRNVQETSAFMQEQVIHARDFALNRQDCANAHFHHKNLKKIWHIEDSAYTLLDRAAEKMHLSMRSYQRIVRVARSIADLQTENTLNAQHVAEALQYRRLQEPQSC